MRTEERTLQRFLDGELQSAEAQAVQTMLDHDSALNESFKAEQAFDELLFESAHYIDDDQQHDHIVSIMNALPAQAPVRKPSFSIAQMGFAALLVISICCSYAYADTTNIGDIIPISLITISSIIIGSLLVFMARPIDQARRSLTARILNQRFNVGQADVLACRCAGLAIILGGAYLML